LPEDFHLFDDLKPVSLCPRIDERFVEAMTGYEIILYSFAFIAFIYAQHAKSGLGGLESD
jgi:hypothetical protein